MEAYKSTCPSCGKVYFWTGYKTGCGKTPAQLAAMHRKETVCKYCGREGLQTELDRKSEWGRRFGAADDLAAQAVKDVVERIERLEIICLDDRAAMRQNPAGPTRAISRRLLLRIVNEGLEAQDNDTLELLEQNPALCTAIGEIVVTQLPDAWLNALANYGRLLMREHGIPFAEDVPNEEVPPEVVQRIWEKLQ